MLSVLIVHAERLFAEALQLAIDAEPDLRCVALARPGHDAVAAGRDVMPDRCLLDLQVPGTVELETCRQLCDDRPGIAVTVLADAMDLDLLRRSQDAGATHVLSKRASVGDVLDAVRADGPHALTVDDHVVIDLARRRESAAARPGTTLTNREVEVLRDMANGAAPKVIAARLGVSVHTVRGHVKSIYWKLDAHNQLEAVAIARQRGLVAVTG